MNELVDQISSTIFHLSLLIAILMIITGQAKNQIFGKVLVILIVVNVALSFVATLPPEQIVIIAIALSLFVIFKLKTKKRRY